MNQKSRKPLYLQIQHYYKNEIALENVKEHEMIPPEREIMEHFNVSRITVANALAGLAKDGWIYRVPGKGSFVQEGAKQLADSDDVVSQSEQKQATEPILFSEPSKPRQLVGLVIPTIRDYFALRLVNGISEMIEEGGFNLVIMMTNNSKDKEREAIREFVRLQVAGLLIFPVDAETYNDDILELKMQSFPFVLIDRYLPGVETNYVVSDNIYAAQIAVSHLWDLRHQQIAICSDSALPTISVEERVKGYMDALKEKGALINPSFLLTDLTVDYAADIKASPLYSIIEQRQASAYITLNARLGVHIVRVANDLGLRVPEDISVLTFDDPSAGGSENSMYTHISQSERLMGKQAAQILLDIMTKPHKAHAGYQMKRLQPELVVRQSTSAYNSF
ncbi:substrate-binding domain-containing protein [Aureibacillus halotolerans]|uniref:GntR family transcriptional regulator of arabinose operon n=1 Tax=Aureibacillus halotolerans TaxID=1508390 RepID=A0A4V3D5Z5_9BACI|nr:substrate-binding domain-containing protein [Aureibacillus halotolerans]TDQ42037.1 GntR family transcriptional regulator of arabinose operon [Aureibacillus halotolerans]